MAKRKAASKGMKCECSAGGLVWLAIGALVIGLGFWAIVKGFLMQQGGAGLVSAVLWYGIGIFVWCFGKGFKRKACSTCFK